MVIDEDLAGPLGLVLNYSTLQQYGVDKVFFLERKNVDGSLKNVVFLSRGESAERAVGIAGSAFFST